MRGLARWTGRTDRGGGAWLSAAAAAAAAAVVGCAAGDTELPVGAGLGPGETVMEPSPTPPGPTPASPDGTPDWAYRTEALSYGVSLGISPSVAITVAGGAPESLALMAADALGQWKAENRELIVTREDIEGGCHRMRLVDALANDARVQAGAYLLDGATGQQTRCSGTAGPGCGPGMLQCGNGACVATADACTDGAPPCELGQYTCPDRSCVDAEDVCDGFANCQTGQDEVGCADGGTSCPSGELACPDGTCVSRGTPCTAMPPSEPPPTCPDGGFACADGSCIVAPYVCDGYADCPAGEDEVGQWTCLDGGSVACTDLCDGFNDCLDASDELCG